MVNWSNFKWEFGRLETGLGKFTSRFFLLGNELEMGRCQLFHRNTQRAEGLRASFSQGSHIWSNYSDLTRPGPPKR